VSQFPDCFDDSVSNENREEAVATRTERTEKRSDLVIVFGVSAEVNSHLECLGTMRANVTGILDGCALNLGRPAEL
jgi:hypothetical protein